MTLGAIEYIEPLGHIEAIDIDIYTSLAGHIDYITDYLGDI